MPSVGKYFCLCLRIKFANSAYQRTAAEGAEIDSEDELDIVFSHLFFSFVSKTGCLEDLMLDHTVGAAGDGGGVVSSLSALRRRRRYPSAAVE